MNKKVGFVYFDELQHIHHFLSPAVELSKMAGYDVDILTYEGEHKYLKSLLKLMAGDTVNIVELSTYFYRKVIEKFTKRLQPSALYIYQKHIDRFLEYEAIIFTDHTAREVYNARRNLNKPLLVLLGHGAGDGDYGYKETHNLFDLAVVAGQKKFERLRQKFPNSKFALKIGGYSKFDVVEVEYDKKEIFLNANPIILYCPHYKREISSWQSTGTTILDFFIEHDEYNLIFAPHYNLFNKKGSNEIRFEMEKYLEAPNIHIDLGSIKSTNMTYILSSDIYLGDVSSQAYEFMYQIRPMIFFNAHNISWENNESYLMWQAGKVVKSISELGDALQNVDEWAIKYEERQKQLFDETFTSKNKNAGIEIAKIISEAI